MLQRPEIIEALTGFLQTIPAVNAVWEGGSTAFNRADTLSDIDMMLDVEDAEVDKVMQQTSAFLDSQFGIELKYDIPPPGWPDMTQTFFRLKNSPAHLLIDFAILKTSAKGKFLEKQIHGTPQIYFDRKNIVTPVDVSGEELKAKLLQRIPLLKARFEIFQVMIEKELKRGNAIDAFAFYLGFTVAPLVEILRIQYAPYQHNFGARYLHITLPKHETEFIQSLYFVANPAELAGKWKLAQAKFSSAIKDAEHKLRTEAI